MWPSARSNGALPEWFFSHASAVDNCFVGLLPGNFPYREINSGCHSRFNAATNIFSAEFFGNINKVDGAVEGSKISTDIGTFSNKNFPSGSKVDVLIRQDGIRISPEIENTSFNGNLRVCDVRYSGNSSLVRIGIGNWPEPHTHIVARELGRISLEKGEPINLEIDHNRAFIFKK